MTPRTAGPRPRGYALPTTSEKRRALLKNAGLDLPDLTAFQAAQLYGLARLATDVDLAPHTLRRVLLGEHGKEPIAALHRIAHAPGWKETEDAPSPDFYTWRMLWHEAHDRFVAGSADD